MKANLELIQDPQGLEKNISKQSHKIQVGYPHVEFELERPYEGTPGDEIIELGHIYKVKYTIMWSPYAKKGKIEYLKDLLPSNSIPSGQFSEMTADDQLFPWLLGYQITVPTKSNFKIDFVGKPNLVEIHIQGKNLFYLDTHYTNDSSLEMIRVSKLQGLHGSIMKDQIIDIGEFSLEYHG